MERINNGPFSTTASLFFTAIFSLLILVALNALWRKRFSARTAFRQGELLTAYSLLCIGTAMAAVDFGSPLMTLIAHPFRFGTADNGWERFYAYLPEWLTVRDKDALKGYYEGNSTLYKPAHLLAWVPPLLRWAGFIALLLWTMACLNTLIRKQWVDRERLTFPIIQLPVALTQEDGALFRNRLFWLGAALSGGLSLVNGLHYLFPAIPTIPINEFQLGDWFQEVPWRGLTWESGGWLPAGIFPFIIGLGYLLPVDLLFSCWFFYLFYGFQRVAFLAMGFTNDKTRYPYTIEQMFGAFMAVLIASLWSARGHLREVIAAALAKEKEENDPNEPMSYRFALFGALFGYVALVAFSAAAGMPVFLSVLFFLVYFAIALAVTRMRAELGPPTHDLHFVGPNATLFSIFGSANIDRHSMGVFTLFYWFNRAYRAHPMAHELEGFQMARLSGLSPRRMPFVMVVAGIIGIFFTCWVTLDISYRLGAAAQIHGWSSLGAGNEAYTRLNNWISQPSPPDIPAMGGMIVGFLFAGMLIVARQSVYGLPFHALGYALSGGWSMMWASLSLFLAWLIKLTILRFGGLRAYRLGLPFFFGLIVGDMMMGAFWSILGLWMDIPIYSIWSG